SSERWALEAYHLGNKTGEPDTITAVGAQLGEIRYFQGLYGELVEQTARFAGAKDSVASWRAAFALSLSEGGREQEALELARVEDLRAIRSDDTWAIAAIIWAAICARHAFEGVEDLYELFSPYPGQLVATGGIVVYGSTDWALGIFAATLGRHDDAHRHFADSAEVTARLGAPLLLALTRASWARSLIARGFPEDIDRARPMLADAGEVAERMGAGGITRAVAECNAALSALTLSSDDDRPGPAPEAPGAHLRSRTSR
ncbi:MAG TPA: hypothetical protein VKG62_04950, partial [Solirubrobacteraceae bacterium]|nr:hypothetical protein [Solirubrobacteraceae bacterium]